MLDDAAQLARDLTPYATTAITAYGAAVLTRVQDQGADATVSFGQRLLRRLTGRDAGDRDGEPTAAQEALAEAVRALAETPQDGDLTAVLRVELRRLLHTDPDLSAEIAAWPRPAAPTITVSTSGERSPATGINYGMIHTGDTPPERPA